MLERPIKPRTVLLAGPNGSGKSTFFERELAQDFAFVNADRIAKQLESEVNAPTAQRYAAQLARYRQTHLEARDRFAGRTEATLTSTDAAAIERAFAEDVRCKNVRDAVAAQLASAERFERLEQGRSFASETVFSHPSKLDFLRDAKAKGFDTRVVFIATENPRLNVARVEHRVAQGGHDVPEDKIVSRYHRALENLRLAIPIADRVEVYDNSREGRDHRLVMSFARGRLLELEPEVPRWAQRTLGDYLAERRLERTQDDREALGRLGYPNAQASGRFEGAVRLDEQNAPVFPFRNAEGKTVAVLYGKERLGDERAVWSSVTKPHDTRLVITHSPQEALAHAELNKSTLGHTRYLAVGDREAQHGPVARTLSDLKPDARVIIAVPDTVQGHTLAARLFELAESQALSASRALPRGGRTWQETLEVQQTRTLEREQER